MTVSIRAVTSGELLGGGELGSAGSFAVRIGHFFHCNLVIAWAALPHWLLCAACASSPL